LLTDSLVQQFGLGFALEFAADVKRSWFSVRKSLRAARNPGESWLQGRVLVGDRSVRVTTREESEEFKPARLSWIAATTFRVSGVSEGPRLKSSVLRFASEEAARFAAQTILSIGQVVEERLADPVDEIEAMIETKVLLDRLVKFEILTTIVISLVTVGNGTFYLVPHEGIELAFVYVAFIFFAIFARIAGKEIAAGPGTSWIRPRNVKAFLSVTEDYLMVRTRQIPEAFSPSEIKWRDSLSFIVKADEARFRLLFRTPEEAVNTLKLITKSFPQTAVSSFSDDFGQGGG
jgi:hypothetical protein